MEKIDGVNFNKEFCGDNLYYRAFYKNRPYRIFAYGFENKDSKEFTNNRLQEIYNIISTFKFTK